jgi:hypothetical protein
MRRQETSGSARVTGVLTGVVARLSGEWITFHEGAQHNASNPATTVTDLPASGTKSPDDEHAWLLALARSPMPKGQLAAHSAARTAAEPVAHACRQWSRLDPYRNRCSRRGRAAKARASRGSVRWERPEMADLPNLVAQNPCNRRSYIPYLVCDRGHDSRPQGLRRGHHVQHDRLGIPASIAATEPHFDTNPSGTESGSVDPPVRSRGGARPGSDGAAAVARFRE